MINNTIAIIMGGGAGTRLFPLTQDRAKPAVSLGAKYRLVDIPVSNCINSGLNRMYVLTQFNSESLNRHISSSYQFDMFSRGCVEILAAEQRYGSDDWYQGTADAVRQNIKHFNNEAPKFVLILSGDQLYQMDYYKMYRQHIENNADISVSVTQVSEKDTKSFGIMKINRKGKISDFIEKPTDPEALANYKLNDNELEKLSIKDNNKPYLASMGIYLFNYEILLEVLDSEGKDFGKDIIPYSIKNYDVYSYIYGGYWEDIGTIKSFWEANLSLTDTMPKFNFYNENSPIYTHSRFLPPSKINSCELNNVIFGEGSIITKAALNRCVVGIRSVIREEAHLENVFMMGADYYEDTNKHRIHLGIGKNTVIKNAIIDKNARIGKNCQLENKQHLIEADGDNYFIRDGIIIIPKNGIIKDGTVL